VEVKNEIRIKTREHIQRDGKRESRKRRKKLNGKNSVTYTWRNLRKVRNFLEYASLLEEAANPTLSNGLSSLFMSPAGIILTDSSCITDRFTKTSSRLSIAL
jgi:hypothetical protein